jgi:hypothetical protein
MAAGLLIGTIASYAQVGAEMVTLAPYEYTYFSPLVGGLPGAAGQYDTDYYGTCGKAAAEWLTQNYRQYTTTPAPTIDSWSLMQPMIAPYLPTTFRESATQPDFFLSFTRYNDDLRYPGYRVIHTVAAEGVPLCVVKVNPAIIHGSSKAP